MTINKLDPLYKKSAGSDGYVCSITGNTCDLATKHFSEFKAFLQKLVEAESNLTFFTDEENLCDKNKCLIYQNTMSKISEYIKDNVQKTK